MIYGLADPTTSECRYIGKTKESLTTRLRRHISHVNQGRTQHVSNWIRQLLSKNLKPEIFLIETAIDWQEAEIFWIEYFRFIGCHLTNISSGGFGIPMTTEIAAKISATRRAKGIKPTKSAIINSLITRSLRWQDPDFRRQRSIRVSETQKILWQDPTHRDKMRKARLKGWNTRRSKQKTESGI